MVQLISAPKPQERKTCFLPIDKSRGIRRSKFDEYPVIAHMSPLSRGV